MEMAQPITLYYIIGMPADLYRAIARFHGSTVLRGAASLHRVIREYCGRV